MPTPELNLDIVLPDEWGVAGGTDNGEFETNKNSSGPEVNGDTGGWGDDEVWAFTTEEVNTKNSKSYRRQLWPEVVVHQRRFDRTHARGNYDKTKQTVSRVTFLRLAENDGDQRGR